MRKMVDNQIAIRMQQKRPLITQLYQRRTPISKIGRMTGENYKTLTMYLTDWGMKKPQATSFDNYKFWIIRNYLDRTLSVESIAKKLKVKPSAIINALRSWGIPRDRGFYRKKTEIIHNMKSKIINLYVDKGWTAAQIGKKFGLAEPTIQLRLKEWGIPARSYEKAVPQKVKELYDKGYSPEDIAKQLDSSSGAIYKVLVEKFGIHHTKKVQFSQEEDELISRMSSQGYSVPIIQAELNKQPGKHYSDTVIRRRLQDLQIVYKPSIRQQVRSKSLYKQEIPEVVVQKIKELRERGFSLQRIAYEMDKPITFISRVIKKYSIPVRNKVFTPEVQKEVGELYQNGLHYKEIADRLGLKDDSVRQELTRMGFPRFESKYSKSYSYPDMVLQNQFIKKYYGAPYFKSMKQIAADLKIDKTTVRDRLKKMGIKIMSKEELAETRKTSIPSIQIMDLQNKIIKKYYGAPHFKSVEQIARAIRMDRKIVKDRLKMMGISIMSREELVEARRTKMFSNYKDTRITIKRNDRRIMGILGNNQLPKHLWSLPHISRERQWLAGN